MFVYCKPIVCCKMTACDWREIEVFFEFSILENTEFTKNISCIYEKKTYFYRPVLVCYNNDKGNTKPNTLKTYISVRW